MRRGLCPTMSVLKTPPGLTIARSCAVSSGEQTWPPPARSASSRRDADRRVGDDGALGRAERAPVERGAREDVGRGLGEVGRAVHVDRHVARADAVGGLALRVGRAHHRPAARGEDDARERVLHQRVRRRERDAREAVEEALGRARGDGRLGDDADGLGRAAGRPRVRAHHDGAARLGGEDGLVEGRRGRVGARHERGDDAHRRRDLPHRRGLADDAGRPQAFHARGERARGEEVLLRLGVDAPEAGLLDGDRRERARPRPRRPRPSRRRCGPRPPAGTWRTSSGRRAAAARASRTSWIEARSASIGRAGGADAGK